MKNTKIIQLSPDKENIRYIVEKAKNEEIGETLSWLLHDLNLFCGDMDKTVIFCCSIKECGEIYENSCTTCQMHSKVILLCIMQKHPNASRT